MALGFCCVGSCELDLCLPITMNNKPNTLDVISVMMKQVEDNFTSDSALLLNKDLPEEEQIKDASGNCVVMVNNGVITKYSD